MNAAVDSIIAQVFPNEDPATLARQRGQFHGVILGTDRVVSIARTPAVASRIPGRVSTLGAVGRLGLNVPIPRIIDVQRTYMVMTRIFGTPLEPSGSHIETQRLGVIQELVHLLRSFWQLDQSGLGEAGIRHESPSRWKDFARDCATELFPLMSSDGKQKAQRELDAVLEVPRISNHLVHGDLGGTNLLWTIRPRAIRLTGVLDWDEVHIGDPAEDLAAIQATFGDDVLTGILTDVRPIDGILSRIKAIRGTFALQQTISAFHDGDDAELSAGLREYV